MTSESLCFRVGDFWCSSADLTNSAMEDDITNTFTCDTEKTRALSVPYITFCQNILLVEPGYKRVLIDSGVGQGDSDDAGHFLDRLPAENIKPESIDTVMISHYHPDHAGNPTFPNASFVVPSQEDVHCMREDVLAGIDRSLLRSGCAAGAGQI